MTARKSGETLSRRYWAVVPAAGVGRRFGSEVPKQYLEVAGRRVIEHTLTTLLSHPSVAGTVVVLAKHDTWWHDVQLPDVPAPMTAEGGEERCHSVLSGLRVLEAHASPQDWVLVHDAARPCISLADIDALIRDVQDDDIGGLLGTPVGDTLKRVSTNGTVSETVPRDGLWRALTPQMFRVRALSEALEACIRDDIAPTDECQAVERFFGATPRMVAGNALNIKVTHPSDLDVVARYFDRAG